MTFAHDFGFTSKFKTVADTWLNSSFWNFESLIQVFVVYLLVVLYSMNFIFACVFTENIKTVVGS